MKWISAATAATIMLALPATAQATIVVGTFTGVVDTGYARGNYGYAFDPDNTPVDNLAGQTITGTFSYDTAALGAPCGSSGSWAGAYYYTCFAAGSGMTITHTINGVTEVFSGNPSPTPGLQYNESLSALSAYNPAANVLELGTYSSIGTPSAMWRGHWIQMNMELPQGTLTDLGNPVFNYFGAVQNSPYGSMIYAPQLNGYINSVSISAVTNNFLTQHTGYSFSITSLTIAAAVPEPASWAMMIGGFGLVGGAMRRQRRATPAAC